jgi:pimeloyl-ACP methyl ester carboxylesterase
MTATKEGAGGFLVGRWPAQLWCHRLVEGPAAGDPRTVVFIHGGSHTSSCWLETPDGRDGWARRFAAHGWEVLVVDYLEIGQVYPVLERTVRDVLDGLTALLQRVGPATVIGHSLGGGLALKLAELVPDLVEAVVLLAPAAVERRNPAVAEIEPGHLARLSRETALRLLANSPRFPSANFDVWFDSLVGYSPHLRNAGAGVTDELKVDRTCTELWQRIPTLILLAEDDRTVAVDAAAGTAAAMGVTPVLLGADWQLPGHAHMFIVEQGSETIADRVLEWLHA